MNDRLEIQKYPERAIKASQINAMGLIDEILHIVVELYRQQLKPDVMGDLLESLQKKFGAEKIDQTLRAVALDIQQETQCQPLLASIQQVKHQQVHIRLGSIHGLGVGDHISLIQVQRDPQHANIRRLVDSPIQLTITEVTAEGAWAASASQQLINHIQVGDIVSIVNR